MNAIKKDWVVIALGALVLAMLAYKNKGTAGGCGSGCTDCDDCNERASQFGVTSAELHSYAESQRLAQARGADPLDLAPINFYKPTLALSHLKQSTMGVILPGEYVNAPPRGGFGASWGAKVNYQ